MEDARGERLKVTVKARTGRYLVLLLAFVGCSKPPYELAPVSGVVTLDGQPLTEAVVSFAPIGGRETTIVGPGSTARTAEAGRYILRTFKEEKGAVVGTHKVRVSTYRRRFVDFKTSDKLEVVAEERVPKHYNKKTTLTFDVPPGGVDDADFSLVSD